MTTYDISVLNRNFAKIQHCWIKKTAIDWKELIEPIPYDEFDEIAGLYEYYARMERAKAERRAYIDLIKKYRGLYDNSVADDSTSISA